MLRILDLKALVFCCVLWGLFSCKQTPKKNNKENLQRYSGIHSGIALFDQFNNEVNAHGGCIVQEKGRYYLFGEFKSDTSNAFVGFSCYSSTDLMNWKFEKIVLPQQEEGLLGPNRVGERVKVMKSPATNQFVMYMHCDDLGYRDPHIGYATSETIDGDYTFHGAIMNNDEPLRRWDMGTFQESDRTGYLLSHEGNIYKLSSDYKSIDTLIVSGVAPGGESPAMFKRNGIYYWLFSNKTSWERNDNYYLTASSIQGPWVKKGLFAPEGSLTWNSQCSFVLPITSNSDTLFMYMGDRWSFPKQGSSATYVWQPISFEGDEMIIPKFQESWTFNDGSTSWTPITASTQQVYDLIDHRHGEWQCLNGKLSVNNKNAKIKYSVYGSQIEVRATTNNTSGYGQLIIYNSRNEEVINTIIDFYSKTENSSQVFLSPVLEKDQYTINIIALGEYPKWSDKRQNRFGSTDSYINLEKLSVVK